MESKRPLDKREPDFFKLRAEWILYFTIVTKNPETLSTNPNGLFARALAYRNYEDFVAAPTTAVSR